MLLTISALQEVSPNSPAAEAGLESQLDYIVGTPGTLHIPPTRLGVTRTSRVFRLTDQVFSDSEDFYTLIQTNVGVTVQLYVYNLRDDNIRLVSLRPRKDWGGVGWYLWTT
jgi:S1-C subfamily serine protease